MCTHRQSKHASCIGILCLCQLIVIGATFKIKVPCEAGWTESTYSGTCLAVYQQRRSWDGARVFCKVFGGDLVKVLDSEMNRFVLDLALLHLPSASRFFIGLSRKKTRGKFKWLEETTAANYMNWDLNEPNSVGRSCAEVRAIGVFKGKWRDKPCSGNTHFVCEKGSAVCPSGWLPSAPSGTCVKIEHARKSWDAARAVCQAHAGDLLVIRDANMNRFIFEQVLSTEEGQRYWIGLNDREKEGRYVWLDSGDEATYLTWAPTQPNNLHNDDCVEIFHPEDHLLRWFDHTCYSESKFICEKFQVCDEGKYGRDCSQNCSANCAESGKACLQPVGRCSSGCVSGYRGASCDTECSSRIYGENCLQNCSRNCGGSHKACDSKNGTCLNGCEAGYQGDRCDTFVRPSEDGGFGLIIMYASFTAPLLLALWLVAILLGGQATTTYFQREEADVNHADVTMGETWTVEETTELSSARSSDSDSGAESSAIS